MYLKENGYIDDEKLLERYKEIAIQKGEGPLKLKSKLYPKGITSVKFSYQEEYEAAVNRIKKYSGNKDFKSIVKYLLNRGFGYSVSSEVATKYINGEI